MICLVLQTDNHTRKFSQIRQLEHTRFPYIQANIHPRRQPQPFKIKQQQQQQQQQHVGKCKETEVISAYGHEKPTPNT